MWTKMFGFMRSPCTSIIKETRVHISYLVSSEDIFKKNFLLKHSWTSASDFIFNIFMKEYMKVSFLFTFFIEKVEQNKKVEWL